MTMAHTRIVQQHRGDGTTTRQLQLAPDDAVFIWCNNDIHHPQKLVIALGRLDIKVRPRHFIENDCMRLRGIENLRLVLDHALELTKTEHQNLMALTRGEGWL